MLVAEVYPVADNGGRKEQLIQQMAARQFLSQFRGIIVRIEIYVLRSGADRFHRTRRRAEWVLIRGQLDHGHAGFRLRVAQSLARHVASQAAYVSGNQIENCLFHSKRSVTGLCITARPAASIHRGTVYLS